MGCSWVSQVYTLIAPVNLYQLLIFIGDCRFRGLMVSLTSWVWPVLMSHVHDRLTLVYSNCRCVCTTKSPTSRLMRFVSGTSGHLWCIRHHTFCSFCYFGHNISILHVLKNILWNTVCYLYDEQSAAKVLGINSSGQCADTVMYLLLIAQYR